MKTSALWALPFLLLSSMASAQTSGSTGPGSGDVPRVSREFDAMMRDGRYQRLLEEQRANKQAFDNLQQRASEPTAVGSIQPRRR